MLTRAFSVLAVSAAMTAAALPAHAIDEPVSVRDRLGQISLVEDAVPVRESPLATVRNGTVRLGSGAAAVSLDLPVSDAAPVQLDGGRYVVPHRDGASLAVAPTATGTQILVGVESADAPQRYAFELDAPAGFTPRLTADGAVQIADRSGQVAAHVDAPWAVDAAGRRVPTRFEVRDGAITQVVDHRAGDFAYPIVADPKVKFCDWKTAACVKFTKKETKRIAKRFSASITAGVSTLCSIIPGGVPGLAVKAICASVIHAYVSSIRKSFVKARKQGKCVEVKFRIIGPAIATTKVVRC